MGPAGTGTGLRGNYFNNVTLSGTPVLTRTEAVDFAWNGRSPGPGVSSNAFSARWTGTLTAPSTGTYRFQTNSDDGVRLWVNGVQVVADGKHTGAKPGRVVRGPGWTGWPGGGACK